MYVYIYIYVYTWNPFVLCFPSKARSFPIKTRDIWVPGIYIYYCVNSCHKATKDTCLSCLMLGLLQDIIYLSSHEQCIPSKLDLQVTKKCLFRPADNTRKDLWYPYLFIYVEPRLKSWQIITVFWCEKDVARLAITTLTLKFTISAWIRWFRATFLTSKHLLRRSLNPPTVEKHLPRFGFFRGSKHINIL